MPPLSPLRAKLSSFDHAYTVAIRLRDLTGVEQYIVRTGLALQPFRVVPAKPGHDTHIMALVA